MRGEYFTSGLMAALAVLLVTAAVTDLKSRTISNRLNLAVALLAPAYWWANGLSPWPGMAMQLCIGLAIFAFFTGLFVVGMMGGGDVKLLGAIALWFPWQAILSILVIMALIGGLVTIATIFHHRATRRIGRPEIPYGVAISAAALWAVGERYINHFG